jgi:hypothetical protein
VRKVKVKKGQRVRYVGSQQNAYKYGITFVTKGHEYEVIRGFGDKCLELGTVLSENEFNIIDDIGCAQWFTLEGLEDEKMFELVE